MKLSLWHHSKLQCFTKGADGAFWKEREQWLYPLVKALLPLPLHLVALFRLTGRSELSLGVKKFSHWHWERIKQRSRQQMEYVSRQALGTQFSYFTAPLICFRGSLVGSVLVTAEYTCAKVPEYDSTGSSRCSEDFRIMCSPVGVNWNSFVSITMDILKKNIFQKLLIFIISIALCIFYSLTVKVKEN